jgi:nitroreductase
MTRPEIQRLLRRHADRIAYENSVGRDLDDPTAMINSVQHMDISQHDDLGGSPAFERIEEVLSTTREMRRLSTTPIDPTVLDRILRWAQFAPASDREAKVRLVVVDDPVIRSHVGEVWRRAFATLYRTDDLEQLSRSESIQVRSTAHMALHIREAPVLVAAYSTSGRTGPSAYPVMWQLCLAARAHNVGSVFTTLLAHLGYDEIDQILGVPDDGEFRLAGLIPLGFPLGNWGVPRRRPLAETTRHNQWDRSWSAL